MDLMMMDRVGDKKMEGCCSTGQSPQWTVVPVEEEEEEEELSSWCHSHLRNSQFRNVFVVVSSNM
jgi:hypothetical protein